ncbi:MAG: hypothetical protein ACK4QL_01155 [Pseudanabaenaceae cyanobacterium]
MTANKPSPERKKLYSDAIEAELNQLFSETELLFKQLQALSRQSLVKSGASQ